jgi:hypothetical protein
MVKINKKGFLRIVEATIAVMIVLGSLVIISSNKEVQVGRDITETLPPFLEEVAENPTLRNNISLVYDVNKDHNESRNAFILGSIEEFLRPRINSQTLDYEVRICALENTCFIEPYPKAEEIFAAERVISTSISSQEFSPKKLKIFVWKRY